MGFIFIGRTIAVSDTPICRRISMMQNMGNTHHGERDFLSRINYLRHTSAKFHFGISVKGGNWRRENRWIWPDGARLRRPIVSMKFMNPRNPSTPKPAINHPSCMQSAWWTLEWFEKKRKRKQPARQLLLSSLDSSADNQLYGLFRLERDFVIGLWPKVEKSTET